LQNISTLAAFFGPFQAFSLPKSFFSAFFATQPEKFCRQIKSTDKTALLFLLAKPGESRYDVTDRQKPPG